MGPSGFVVTCDLVVLYPLIVLKKSNNIMSKNRDELEKKYFYFDSQFLDDINRWTD